MNWRQVFDRFSRWTARKSGTPASFGIAFTIIVAWALTGPIFHYTDTWQLVINTGTTIVTFLMVFLIQNTQNRDAEAMQLKLNELIRSLTGAHNALLDLEEMTQEDLDRIRQRYAVLAQTARADVREGRGDVDTPAVDVE